MLATPIARVGRRQYVRSLCMNSAEANSYIPPEMLSSRLGGAVSQLQAIVTQVLPNLYNSKLSPNHSHYQSNRIHRQYCSEPSPSKNSSSGHIPLFNHNASEFRSNKAPRQQQCTSGTNSAATNDAQAASTSKSSCVGVPHDNESLSDKPQQTNSLGLCPGQAKSPAQREWERLWYSGVNVAFSKVAHHFPEVQLSSTGNTVNLNISEPSLAISRLPPEDRTIFEKEERTTARSAFAPTSEEDRLHRLSRASQAADETQKLALLLDLPTFQEYLEKKSQNLTSAHQNALTTSKRQLKREARQLQKTGNKKAVKAICRQTSESSDYSFSNPDDKLLTIFPGTRQAIHISNSAFLSRGGMTHERKSSKDKTPLIPAQHRPLVVGLTKPQSARSTSTMASSSEAAALNKEIEQNVNSNTAEAAPSEDNPTAPASQKPKKEKAPKQPKPQKAAPVAAPTSPALIDLRVGHILRAITHPNADSLYVSTIAMGDPEGTEHTQVDEETGKVVRTVCSGLNGLIPLEEMQNRKIVVVANLKPVNMRSIKSAAMVLAASPKQPEGADPHAPDRVVELVQPPEGSEAGDKVYFEGWPYGEGKGPEKVLNPKKKQWEAIQPGFYTGDDLTVAFDAGSCEEVEGSNKGNLVVEGKGPCTVKTLKGAVVR